MNPKVWLFHLPWNVLTLIEHIAKLGGEPWQGALNTKEWALDIGPVSFLHNYMGAYGGHAASQIQLNDKPVLTAQTGVDGVELTANRFRLVCRRENQITLYLEV